MIGIPRSPHGRLGDMPVEEKCPVTLAAEPMTTPIRHVPAGRRAVVAGSVAVLCLAAVLAEATADVLPDAPLVGVVTPVRLVLAVGLVAVWVAGTDPVRMRTWLDPAVALLVVAAAVATVVAGQDWAPWRGVLTTAAVFYLAVGVRRAVPGSWPACGLLALVATGVAGPAAARQSAGGTATGFCRGAFVDSADVCGPDAVIRAVGTFSNPNLLAAFLVLLLPLAAAGSAALADRSSRLVGTGVVAFGYAAVLLTASRGGVLAALAGITAFLVLQQPTRRRLLLAGTVGVLGVGVLALVSHGSVGVRGDIWGAALRIVAAHPLGVGPGRAGPMLDAAIPGPEAFQHAHDLWLNWAVEAGVPGLVAVLAVTVVAGVVAVLAARRGSRAAVACGAGLAGFAVMSLADDPANAIRVSLALWAVLGLLAAEMRPGRQPATTARSRSGSR